MSVLNTLNSLSFLDYKINYNRCLGSGTFGTVYEVVKRPENEKGYISYLLPYAYDYIFPVDEKNKVDTSYCVKISNTAARIFFETDSITLMIRSFSEPLREKKTNEILLKHEVSRIQFYKTYSLYSQFKTKINGHTFSFYYSNGYFTNKNEFILRKSFVNFLHLISNPNICCRDLHGDNIMYDEQENHWDIIDGFVDEIDSGNHKPIDNITHIYHYFHFFYFNKIEERVFNKLSKVARKKQSFTKSMDAKLFEKISSLKNISLKK